VAGSAPFEAICAVLESSGLDRWTARGTLQLSLMDAGIDASAVTAAQLAIIVERLLPRQLQSHRDVDVNAVMPRLRAALDDLG
jgi:hypothetical protein